MTVRVPKWAEIERAYRSGATLSEISARFGVSLRELLQHIRAENSGRSASEPRPAGPTSTGRRHGEPACLPVLLDDATRATIDSLVVEAAADIAVSHKVIAGKLRKRLEAELVAMTDGSMREWLAEVHACYFDELCTDTVSQQRSVFSPKRLGTTQS